MRRRRRTTGRGHGTLTCREMVERLADYLDADLDARLKGLVDAHGGHCPPCRAFVRTLQATVRAVRALPREPLPPEARDALAEALRKAGGPRSA